MLFNVKMLFLKIVSQLCTALQQTPNYSIFPPKKWKKEKSGAPNIKDPISLFKDTRHLLLCSHKHAVSQKQMESSILTEAACGAEKYQCEETCSILSTLTQDN